MWPPLRPARGSLEAMLCGPSSLAHFAPDLRVNEGAAPSVHLPEAAIVSQPLASTARDGNAEADDGPNLADSDSDEQNLLPVTCCGPCSAKQLVAFLLETSQMEPSSKVKRLRSPSGLAADRGDEEYYRRWTGGNADENPGSESLPRLRTGPHCTSNGPARPSELTSPRSSGRSIPWFSSKTKRQCRL